MAAIADTLLELFKFQPSNNTHPKTQKEVHYNDYITPIILKIAWHAAATIKL